MAETGALERGRENATGIVSSFVTGTWLLALLAGFDWWLWFMLFGYIVLIPTVSRLFGEADEEWQDDEDWEDGGRAEDEAGRSSAPTSNNRDALETLRDRYARGELTDEQFERKVERLLETETLEDVEDRARASASGGDAEVDTESDEFRRETNR